MTEIIKQIIKLPRALPPVLAVGAYLKNNLCLIQSDEAWISQDVGSLDNPTTIKSFYKMAEAMIACAKCKPVAVAHDWHPDFPCTRWAKECGLPPLSVQHHHAHVASVMAEHGHEDSAIGVVLDGFGLGEDNAAWGGELLHVDKNGFNRIGHLKLMHQPGGDIAALQPWRMGAAALYALGQKGEIATRYSSYDGAEYMAQVMDGNFNVPLTSSGGRLFDAACGLLNIKPVASFEGEAPMAMEAMVTTPEVMREGWRIEGRVLDMRPLLLKIMDCTQEKGANLFHGTLAIALIDWFQKAAKESDTKTVVLGGGCFLNQVLRKMIERETMSMGFNILWPKELPAGDQAISLGQAYAAAMMLEKSRSC